LDDGALHIRKEQFAKAMALVTGACQGVGRNSEGGRWCELYKAPMWATVDSQQDRGAGHALKSKDAYFDLDAIPLPGDYRAQPAFQEIDTLDSFIGGIK
jgi:hypothetical protein